MNVLVACLFVYLSALVKAESCAVASDCMALACKGMEACEMGTCTCATMGGPTTKSPDGVLHGNRKHYFPLWRQLTVIHCLDKCTM